MNYADYSTFASAKQDYARDSLRLEIVTTSVGFDDILDYTLGLNHPHADTVIVVTSHEDTKTQMVAKKHGAICVVTDLFRKNGRSFNKGAAINSGFGRFQYRGWRMHLDADIILPDNFRRLLFNHSHLEEHCIYGADRINVVGKDALTALHQQKTLQPQSIHSCLIVSTQAGDIGARYVDPLRGYCPLGFCQLWHASHQKDYPYSMGTACHDDVMFSEQWPTAHRRHLPSAVCYQLCGSEPKWGENWDGNRGQKRLQ